MCMRAGMWDNDLVNRKEEQMKPIKITKQDRFGYDRTFIIRRDDAGSVVFEVTVAYLPSQSI